MLEPTLEAISDYDTLQGTKRRVIWQILLGAMIMGGIYVLSYNYFGNVSDSIPVEKSIGLIPLN